MSNIKCVKGLQISIRVLQFSLILLIFASMISGYRYCHPVCERHTSGEAAKCDSLPVWQLQTAPGADTMYYTIALVVIFAIWNVIVQIIMPLCRTGKYRHWPFILPCCALSAIIAVLSVYYGTCPWDRYWQNAMMDMRDTEPNKYESILIDLQIGRNLTERDLFCLLFAPCYVVGWIAAAAFSMLTFILYIVDMTLSAWRGLSIHNSYFIAKRSSYKIEDISELASQPPIIDDSSIMAEQAYAFYAIPDKSFDDALMRSTNEQINE